MLTEHEISNWKCEESLWISKLWGDLSGRTTRAALKQWRVLLLSVEEGAKLVTP